MKTICYNLMCFGNLSSGKLCVWDSYKPIWQCNLDFWSLSIYVTRGKFCDVLSKLYSPITLLYD